MHDERESRSQPEPTHFPESPYGEQSLVAGPATNGDCGVQSGMLREHENADGAESTSHLSDIRETPTPDESNRHAQSSSRYQPRYVAYATNSGRTPEQQGIHDDAAWPGGCMTGFALWISARWAEWHKATGFRGVLGQAQHDEFDAWLKARSQ